MRLTQQTNYSIRILIYCAANAGRTVKVGEIARVFAVSELHLFKILKVLVDAHLVRTQRGPHGGVTLARPPETITVGDVVRSTEENFHLADCFDPSTADCPINAVCDYNALLHDALEAFLATLDRKTIADLAAGRPDVKFLLDLRREETTLPG
jgi:Rrf2 family iron-responsive transcriptional regulator